MVLGQRESLVMSDSKLLTKTALRHEIDRYLCNAVPGVDTITGRLNGIMQIVEAQKIAHANMCIGEDEHGWKRSTEVAKKKFHRNQLRAEQRERNKV